MYIVANNQIGLFEVHDVNEYNEEMFTLYFKLIEMLPTKNFRINLRNNKSKQKRLFYKNKIDICSKILTKIKTFKTKFETTNTVTSEVSNTYCLSKLINHHLQLML